MCIQIAKSLAGHYRHVDKGSTCVTGEELALRIWLAAACIALASPFINPSSTP